MLKQTIQEHQTCMIYNGEPILNDLPFKICDNPLNLFLNGGTTITMIDMPKIITHKFDFKPIIN